MWPALAAAVGSLWRGGRRPFARRGSLPPGEGIRLDEAERSNRKILLELAAAHGAIFKVESEDRLCVCVVGLALGRRLLQEHATALLPVTLNLRDLFPEGFMRQMEGDCHRHYRDMLNRGINALVIDDMAEDLAAIAKDKLASAAREMQERKVASHEYRSMLGDIATGMLVRLFFGAPAATPQYEKLRACYHQLGPHGVVWNITDKQKEAFAALRDELRSQLEKPHQGFQSGLLGRMAAQGDVDDAMLGNLIYMVEMGRYDVRALFRWISKYAADNPKLITRIAGEDAGAASDDKRTLADAFVLEVLRMDQSERLMRNVKNDIAFDGFTIPEGALVRICMWEAHKDSDAFADPFEFNPSRFMTSEKFVNRFSPFGLDQHQCPFSTISVTLGVMFLRILSEIYSVQAIDDGAPIRGAYHWEPNPKFAVALTPRNQSGGRL